jgi:pimeloyl-ACP methyl ester carboxylesterase
LRDLIFDALLCGPEGGAVVVLLHGWPEFSSWWRDSLEALGAAGYRAVAFDQRGYSRGARPLEVAEYCPDRLVHDVLGVADAVGAQSFHIVAHDLGRHGCVGGCNVPSTAAQVADRALDASPDRPSRVP